ncbi:MAG: hypothetical protein NVSMB53_19910 [Gemmatimonadaceae bacterium]
MTDTPNHQAASPAERLMRDADSLTKRLGTTLDPSSKGPMLTPATHEAIERLKIPASQGLLAALDLKPSLTSQAYQASAAGGRPGVTAETNLLAALVQANSAVRFVYELEYQMREFAATLADPKGAGLRLVQFGGTVQIDVENVTAGNQGIVVFDGRNDSGRKARLVSHFSQVSVLLCELPDDQSHNPIGFHVRQDAQSTEFAVTVPATDDSQPDAPEDR